MSWTENEILLNQRPTMASADLFQAVCDEIGKHYVQRGFKYSRSRPKISYTDDIIKLVIGFSSSRSNTPGRHVAFEIIPTFYSVELAKSSPTNGLLFGHTAVFSHRYTDDPKKQRVIQIFGDVLERVDEYTHESTTRDNHYCNIYGIDGEKFGKILAFIDNKILPWVERLKTKEGVLMLTENPTQEVIGSLTGMGVNSAFIPYCDFYFPDLKMRSRLLPD